MNWWRPDVDTAKKICSSSPQNFSKTSNLKKIKADQKDNKARSEKMIRVQYLLHSHSEVLVWYQKGELWKQKGWSPIKTLWLRIWAFRGQIQVRTDHRFLFLLTAPKHLMFRTTKNWSKWCTKNKQRIRIIHKIIKKLLRLKSLRQLKD